MNREYLLDSLDGFKALVFRLFLGEISGSIACVPMTTDGPWAEAEKAIFEKSLGITSERTYWNPGGFNNVPSSRDVRARTKWVDAVATINYRYLFLDPDIGFNTHPDGASKKKVMVTELCQMLRKREAVIVYRHRWGAKRLHDAPPNAYAYVWHGLRMLREANLRAFAYQSQSASLFFISSRESGIKPFRTSFQHRFSGISAEVVERRLVQ